MNRKIANHFRKIVIHSMETGQINYLGALLEPSFDVYKESGFGRTIPLPRQAAAQTLTEYFNKDEDIIKLFTIMLHNDTKRFYNTPLRLVNKNEFIKLLISQKWIYDEDLMIFLLDPFYENEINLLNKLQLIDLRNDTDIDKILEDISNLSKGFSTHDLEWKILVRLYDLDPEANTLIRKLIDFLLTKQDLQKSLFEMYTVFKELAINASKANYKILFERFNTRPLGIDAANKYVKFLDLFKEEIEKHGNKRLFQLAKREDKFITVTFQSNEHSISIWVSNTSNVSTIEKKQIIKKLNAGELGYLHFDDTVEEYTEGAGMGLSIILSILKQYSNEKNPLKVVFYPNFLKIGFELQRTELLNKK